MAANCSQSASWSSKSSFPLGVSLSTVWRLGCKTKTLHTWNEYGSIKFGRFRRQLDVQWANWKVKTFYKWRLNKAKNQWEAGTHAVTIRATYYIYYSSIGIAISSDCYWKGTLDFQRSLRGHKETLYSRHKRGLEREETYK